MYTVDNAVIMAAGTASRFAPLSYEMPKALISVKGEVLIERQIRQLREAGIKDIYIVAGYKAEMFYYLEEKLGVHIVVNPDFLTRNNNASIYAVKDILKNTYICSADNYFSENPFESVVDDCYYSAVYADGETKEWCMEYDNDGTITSVKIGGKNSWFMLGHTFWSEDFSKRFTEILESEYHLPETADKLWESIYIEHIDELKMKIRKYSSDVVFEFDTLDELREFDTSYVNDTRSMILKSIAAELKCSEGDIRKVLSYKDDTNEAAGFTFECGNKAYKYPYKEKELRRI
ncbi:MAG: NTP transferase domain-containing protein [Clostridia bacterium]|nr:NTP transferase domain-containing protein [Clostridia bacterium]